MYEIEIYNEDIQNTAQWVQQCKSKNFVLLWHKTLGHRNYNSVKGLRYFANGVEIRTCKHKRKCETCVKSKTDALYPKKAEHRAIKPLQLVHGDLCVPIQTPTTGGKLYFLHLLIFIYMFIMFTVDIHLYVY